MFDFRLRIGARSGKRGARFAPSVRSSLLTPRSSARRAISLIEVLISMFVLLFGLMGVAAIFPVGNHYVTEGEKFDLASGIAQNAFEELGARGMLRPEVWYYGNHTLEDVPGTNTNTIGGPFISARQFSLIQPLPSNPQIEVGPGHAFVIDSIGASELISPFNLRQYFPASAGLITLTPNNRTNPWADTGLIQPLPGNSWPVRRITLPVPDPTPPGAPPPTGAPPIAMPKPVAETIFRLRDDLSVEQPDESDLPSIQRWDTVDINPLSGNANNTPEDTKDDTFLRRQYKGLYTWLATIVPTTGEGLEALQPSNVDFGEISYDVSVVVFRGREETPSATSERLIEAELLQGGELVIYSTSGTFAKDEVDAAVDDIRPGNWISLMGVNQTTGAFVMKWYRILSMDDETGLVRVPRQNNDFTGRRLMLIGPDWPETPDTLKLQADEFAGDLRAGILPGAISVVTKPLRMEDFSLWKLE